MNHVQCSPHIQTLYLCRCLTVGHPYPSDLTWSKSWNLLDFLHRYVDVGIKLNLEKLELRKPEITVMGHIASKDGLKSDPEKVCVISDMIEPTNCTELRRFIGTVNYLGKFIPHLLETLLPLTSLLHKYVSWTWSSAQQDAFEKSKDLVTSAPTLAFYNPEKELILDCDASEYGLGAALFQEGKPLAFASRTLSDPERRYEQIEIEMLAVSYGLTRFHHYTYGRDVRVISDHKPLESFVKKPLAKAPKHIQNLLLQAQYYSYSLEYRVGKDIPVADTLSRAPLQDKQNFGNKIFHVVFLPRWAVTGWGKSGLQQLCWCRMCGTQEHHTYWMAIVKAGSAKSHHPIFWLPRWAHRTGWHHP